MNQRTVLFVDDEPEILNALKRRMKSEPYCCEYATSGLPALELLKKKEIHILVTDMRMPQMDGLSLIQEVKKKYPDVIRIVLSGMSDSDTILTALNKGDVHRYITKPWDDRDFKTTVRQAIQLYNLKDERRLLLEKLENKNRMLEKDIQERICQLMSIQGQAEIGRYTSQIVHNLSSPLQALNSALDLMDFTCSQSLSMVDAVEINSKLKIAQSAANDLKRIVQGILGHSRKKIDFHIERVDLNTIVEDEITYFRLNPDFEKRITKTIRLSDSLPAITGNSTQIKQVVDNLLKNAIDAMEDTREKTLTVETDFNGSSVILRVIDTGCGIDEKDKERIFRPDFTTKPLGKGTGLGLASVHDIVTAYNGHINVTSTPGKGTIFEIFLPTAPFPTSLNKMRTASQTTES